MTIKGSTDWVAANVYREGKNQSKEGSTLGKAVDCRV